MTAPALNSPLLEGLLTALAADSTLTALLGQYQGEPSIHTRRPAPAEAEYPMVMVTAVTRSDEDGINDYRPAVVVDCSVYGDQPKDFRAVEAAADRLYSLFHRQPRALTVTGWHVTQITCAGPTAAPVDDDAKAGRRVTLTVALYSGN